jgi:hypothetical protein
MINYFFIWITNKAEFIIDDGSVDYEWHYCNIGFRSYYEINCNKNLFLRNYKINLFS